jgi:uncharacterized protein
VARRAFRRALVTGASSGIGAELARELARRGSALVLVARRQPELRALADELGASHAGEVEVLPADLTDPAARAQVEQRLRDDDRPVDVLVNNAGVGQVGRFAELDVDAAERLVTLNVVAPLRLVHAALPSLVRHRGAVLNVSSLGGNQPVPTLATYAATKAFLTNWGEALHEELRGTGVTITTLAPGFTRTEFVAEAEAEDPASRIPALVWSDPVAVARAGIDGLVAGRPVVTPGLLNRAGAAMSAVTPHAVSRRVIGTVARYLD